MGMGALWGGRGRLREVEPGLVGKMYRHDVVQALGKCRSK